MSKHLTDPHIKTVTQIILNAAKDTLGEKLDKVILFGSYARGDFDSDSDVDIFVLADVPHEDTPQWRRDINNRIPDIDLEYDILVCIHVTSKAMFNRYLPVLPFYQNIMKEGVEIHG